MIAAQKGSEEIFQMLMNAGAELNAFDMFNNTVLHHAAMNGHANIVEILLSRPSIDIFKKNCNNKTALDTATTSDVMKCFKNYFSNNQKKAKEGNKVVIHKLEEKNIKSVFKIEQIRQPIQKLQQQLKSSQEFFQNFKEFKTNQQCTPTNSSKLNSSTSPLRKNNLTKYLKSTDMNGKSPMIISKSQPPVQQLKIQPKSKKISDNLSPQSIKNNNNNLTQISEKSIQSNDSLTEKIGPEQFIVHGMIGRGSFGQVFLVQKKGTEDLYAMKVLQKSKIMCQLCQLFKSIIIENNLVKYALAERNVLSVTNHSFIVKLNYAFQTNSELFLILDYCPGGDLGKQLQQQKKFSEDIAKIYLSEIILALENLHKRDIIFRDLKPENIVIDSEGHAKLTDFGLSKEGVFDHNQGAKSFCGSVAYLAPEMLKRQGHGKAVDWYLLGVVMYEMLVGLPPYYTNNKEQLFQNIEKAPLKLPGHISLEAKSLLKSLLQRNPAKRLGSGKTDADEIKQHKFFEGISWSDVEQRKLKPPKPNLNIKLATIPENLNLENKQVEKENKIEGWSFAGLFSELKSEQQRVPLREQK